MEAIRTQSEGSVAVVRMCRGVTNPIGLELVDELGQTLRVASENPDVRGLVLAGSNAKFFSIGWDLPSLVELDRASFREFFDAYNQLCLELYTLPLPTVGAITGHAVAGGCLLALACDWRIIAEGRKFMGLNEVKLGVPIPCPGDRILRQVAGERIARVVTEEGEMFPAEKLIGMGLVDRVLPLVDVESAAIELAGQLGASPRMAFAAIKRSRTDAAVAEIRDRLVQKEEDFLDCWFAEETRSLLREAAEKF